MAGLLKYLDRDPGAVYGDILPYAKDQTSGDVRVAMPNMVREPLTGLLGLMENAGKAVRGEPWEMTAEHVASLPALASPIGAATVPVGTLGMFAGRRARTADLAALARAETMAAKGADRKSILDETGWFQDVDGQWKFEIPDDAATVGTWAGDRFEDAGEAAGKLPAVLWHAPLYDAYPELRGVGAQLWKGRRRAGSYEPNPYFRTAADDGFAAAAPGTVTAIAPNERDLKNILLHEAQHAVQDMEGFATGASPEEMARLYAAAQWQARSGAPGGAEDLTRFGRVEEVPGYERDLYLRNAGEAEARNVEAREFMDAADRRRLPPWQTLDVPEDSLIVQFGARPAAAEPGPWQDILASRDTLWKQADEAGARGDFDAEDALVDQALSIYERAAADLAAQARVTLRHPTEQKGALITPEFDGSGRWRATWFDDRGFSGDSPRPTKEAAIEEALRMGYTAPDGGLFGLLSGSQRFIDGNAATDEMRRLNAR